MTAIEHVTKPVDPYSETAANAERARKLYDQARKALTTDNRRFAIHALGEAICLDLSQRQFAKELLAVLSSGPLAGPGWFARAWPAWRLKRRIATAVGRKDWQTVIECGTKLLALRPNSIPALIGLGQTCAELKHFDSAVVYLRHAHKLRPRDVMVNRHCGRVLGKVGQFDEAIGCWQFVEQKSRRDEEALRAIGILAAKKLF